jgi:hypothetical protein
LKQDHPRKIQRQRIVGMLRSLFLEARLKSGKSVCFDPAYGIDQALVRRQLPRILGNQAVQNFMLLSHLFDVFQFIEVGGTELFFEHSPDFRPRFTTR